MNRDPDKARAWQQRSKPLKRTPMRSSSSRPRKQPSQRLRTSDSHADDFSAATRRAIARRSAGRCEAAVVGVCSTTATACHHRKLRGHGDHSLENGLHVCVHCHTTIHDHPSWAYELGLLVASWDSPSLVAVVRGAPPP